MDVAVLGPGAVGGYLAAALWKAGASVTCVAREENAKRIREEGLRVRSALLGEFTARPHAVDQLQTPPGLLLVTTKAPGLPGALERIRFASDAPTVVVPLLNGIEHMSPLRARFAHVVAGSARIEAIRHGINDIEQTSPFVKVDLSSEGPVPDRTLATVQRTLAAARVDVSILPSEAQVLWGKLARLNAIACTTTASGMSIGRVRSDPRSRDLLVRCLSEGARVAAAHGAAVGVDANLRLIDGLPPNLSSSMHRDLLAGRPLELDGIAGAVVRAGRRHGIACPVTEDLMHRILELHRPRNLA